MKTLLRLTLCAIALLGLHLTANAQKTLHAYIVTAASDTIQGQLLKESESKRTFRIKFDAGSGLETYEAKTIKAYGIGDSLRFEAKDVFVDEMQNHAFLKVIVDGPTKLYYSPGLNAQGHFYIQKPGDPTIQLRKTIYRSILSGILNDCDQKIVEYGSALERKNAYSAASLGKYVHNYNNCKYPEAASQTLVEDPKIKFRFGVLGGGHYSFMNVPTHHDYYKDYSVTSRPGFTAGLLVNIDFRKRFSLQNELLFTQRFMEVNFVYNDPTDIGYTENWWAEANMIQAPILGKYILGNGKLQPYVLGGASLGVTFNNKSGGKVVYESGYNYNINNTELSSFMIGGIAGAGLQQRISNNHQLLLEMRYSFERAGKNRTVKGTYFHNANLLVGFIF